MRPGTPGLHCCFETQTRLANNPPIGSTISSNSKRKGVGRPVAALKRTESKPNQTRSEAETCAAFRKAPVALAEICLDGRWRTVNERLSNLLGYPVDKIEGLPLRDFTEPEDFEAQKGLYNQVLEGEIRNAVFETRFLRQDGSVLTGSVTLSLIRARDGEPQLFMIGIEDISAHKAAEVRDLRLKMRYDSIVHATGQVIYERDPSGGELTGSGDFERLLGYTAEEVCAGSKNWLDFVHPDDRHLLKELSVSDADKKPFHLEYRLIRKDRSIASVRDHGCAILDEPTQKTRLVGILHDVSEQRELAFQLQHAQKMEAFGRLAGGVAHDFNNLLTIFSGYTDMLLSELDPEDPQCEPLGEMQRAAERATALTSQLLAFSRHQRSSPRVINLGTVVLELRKMLRRLIGEDVELVMSIAEDLGSVLADPRQIETVLINLVVNARDAMPRGGRLSIETDNLFIRQSDSRVKAGWKPGAYVQITVRDTGTGMDEEVLARIFEPFFTTKAPGQGTGLGLSTCYGTIKQCGGEITVESAAGKGSAFRILLPQVADPGDDGSMAEPKAPKAVPRGNNETILIVEDDLAVQKTYSTMLRQLGYNVICGSNGDEALRIASQHPEIRLVITDLVMPLMSGTDLAEELRHILPDTKVVLTSGYSSEPVASSGSMSHTTFLPKPLSRDIIAQKLRELLTNS